MRREPIDQRHSRLLALVLSGGEPEDKGDDRLRECQRKRREGIRKAGPLPMTFTLFFDIGSTFVRLAVERPDRS